jgi:prepilin-type N-terminal cleavage/methylation domain-containing protein
MNSFHPCYQSGRVRRAFTLVEIMVVVVIIGLLAMLALPAAMRVRESAQNSRYASDVRTFAQAFETYSLTNGGWPPNAGGGAIPTGMADLLRTGTWGAVNSVGGRWNWDYNNAGVTAGISSTGVTASTAQMTLLDAKMDDGNLTTGQFQLIGARYIFILEQ